MQYKFTNRESKNFSDQLSGLERPCWYLRCLFNWEKRLFSVLCIPFILGSINYTRICHAIMIISRLLITPNFQDIIKKSTRSKIYEMSISQRSDICWYGATDKLNVFNQMLSAILCVVQNTIHMVQLIHLEQLFPTLIIEISLRFIET